MSHSKAPAKIAKSKNSKAFKPMRLRSVGDVETKYHLFMEKDYTDPESDSATNILIDFDVGEEPAYDNIGEIFFYLNWLTEDPKRRLGDRIPDYDDFQRDVVKRLDEGKDDETRKPTSEEISNQIFELESSIVEKRYLKEKHLKNYIPSERMINEIMTDEERERMTELRKDLEETRKIEKENFQRKLNHIIDQTVKDLLKNAVYDNSRGWTMFNADSLKPEPKEILRIFVTKNRRAYLFSHEGHPLYFLQTSGNTDQEIKTFESEGRWRSSTDLYNELNRLRLVVENMEIYQPESAVVTKIERKFQLRNQDLSSLNRDQLIKELRFLDYNPNNPKNLEEYDISDLINILREFIYKYEPTT